MLIEIRRAEIEKAWDNWIKIPNKYRTFKNYQHGGTANFSCKYPELKGLLIKILEQTKNEARG